MRSQFFSNLFVSSSTAFFVLAFFSVRASANYFIISDPAASAQWSNNAANLITWQKAVLDGVNMFDVEMSRMSTDGLTLVARNVPAAQGQLNLFLQDVPAGDDYFLIFINSTHGVLHSTSSRFTILSPSATPSGTTANPAAGVPTVTVSGSPNPTQQFATTFPALASAAQLTLPPVHISQLLLTLLGIVFGAAWTLGWGS
jgi:hypothetical protein